VIYVELDLLLRDRARLQRVVRRRVDVPSLRGLRTTIPGVDRACAAAGASPSIDLPDPL